MALSNDTTMTIDATLYLASWRLSPPVRTVAIYQRDTPMLALRLVRGTLAKAFPRTSHPSSEDEL